MKNKGTHLGLLAFLLLGFLPFLAAFGYALLYSFGLVGVVNKGFTIQFWQAALASGTFFTSFLYSAAIALVSVLMSVGGALWITLKFREYLNRGFLSMVTYLPLAIPGIVTGFFVLQILSKAGFFARVAHYFGWIQEASEFPDLVNDRLAIGMILAFISLILPFFVLLFLNIYKNERVEDLSILAASLGASSGQVTRRVFLPILLHKARILIVLYFIFLLGSYEVPLILGQESPQMLSVLIIRELKQFDLDKISEGYVVAVCYTILVSITALVIFLPKRTKIYAG